MDEAERIRLFKSHVAMKARHRKHRKGSWIEQKKSPSREKFDKMPCNLHKRNRAKTRSYIDLFDENDTHMRFDVSGSRAYNMI